MTIHPLYRAILRELPPWPYWPVRPVPLCRYVYRRYG